MATSYSNPCGTGDRRSLINISVSSGLIGWGALSSLIDGTYSSSMYFNDTTTGYILFDFKTSKIIDEITYKQNAVGTNGTWSWQGSNDNSIWEDIKTNIALGNSNPQIISISTTKGYQYYRLLLTSGATSSGPYIQEIEFKIDNFVKKNFLIKHNNQFYTIQNTYYNDTTHQFIPLTLTGGTIPNKSDIETFGFTDLSVLTNSITFGNDILIPVSKFDNTAELKMYKG